MYAAFLKSLLFFVKECLSCVKPQSHKIHFMINAVRLSIKRRDLLREVCIDLEVSCELPGLDCETRLSSTSIMVKKTFAACRSNDSVIQLLTKLADLEMTEVEWKALKKVGNILECPASLTEHRSGHTYITVSISSMLLERLKR